MEMFRTLVKTDALAVEDKMVAVRYFELRTLRGARRYSAEILLGPGDRIILDDDSLTNLEARLLQLLLDAGLALERLAREILTAGGNGLPRLGVERDDVLLELLRLELEALLGRDDVRDSSFDVLQRLELLLVRVVEGLLWILGAVQKRAEFRPDDLAGT